MLGFENAAAPVDKVRDPCRTIPRALISGTAFVALLYLLVSTAILLLLPVEVAGNSSSPFADAIGRGWGEIGVVLAALAIAVSAAGYVNANVLIIGELGYSMALRREMPGFLARTIGHNTPLNAQLLGTGMAGALILANMSKSTADLFTFVALLTASATLWLYLAAALAALKQRPRGLALVAVLAGLAFTLFAFYGLRLGSKPVEPRPARLWSHRLRNHALARRLQPDGGACSSRASGIIRLSLREKLRRQTSLVPSGPAT